MIELSERHKAMAVAGCNFVYDEVCIRDIYGLTLINRPVGRILDIGAHVGITSIACRHLWPNAQIVCVEPLTGNTAALNRMIYGQNIKLVTGVFGPEKVDLYYSGCIEDKISGDHNFHPAEMWVEPPDEVAYKIGVVGSDLYTLLQNFERLNDGVLIKVDCEGGEWSLIRGMHSQLVIPLVDYMPMEVHTFFPEKFNCVTYDEVAEWAKKYSKTHEILMPESDRVSAGGFMMALLRKGFVSDEQTAKLRQHFISLAA